MRQTLQPREPDLFEAEPAAVPRRVTSIGNVRVVVDRLTTPKVADLPTAAAVPTPVHAYVVQHPGPGRDMLSATLPLAVPDGRAGAGALVAGLTPEVLVTCALDAYEMRLAAGGLSAAQAGILSHLVGRLRDVLTDAQDFVEVANGCAPLECGLRM